MDGEIDALGAEIEDQGVAFEVAIVVRVELDARFASVDFFGDDAAAGEDVGDFLDGDVEGEVGYVDGRVLALAGLGGGFRLFGGIGSTACFLVNGSAAVGKKTRKGKRVWRRK